MKQKLNRLVEISHDRLKRSVVGYEYLTRIRGITVDTIKTERMGFLDVDIVDDFLSDIDVDIWEHPKEYYAEMMCGRVLLPIRDDNGCVVGMSTKVPEKGSKGWWNSVFKKEHILYGLNRAKNAAFKMNKIYLVEGYADAISLWQAGLPNVVAVMGTAFTSVQQGLVLRYCSNVCVCFDTDPETERGPGGGQRGLQKIVTEYNSKGYFDNLSAIVLPLRENGKGEDPDNFVNENGIKRFLDLERGILLY